MLCAGANYYDHIKEMGVPDTRKEAQRLFFFFKPPRNAVVGEGATVHMPIGTKAFDWEIELAAVIGRKARAVKADDALSHIAGYTVASISPRATTTARRRPSTSSTGWRVRRTTPAARWARASCRPPPFPIRRISG